MLVLAFLLPAAGAHGARISWTLPTTYQDGRPLDPVDARKIVVEVYSGPTRTGPWKPVATSGPGGMTATVPDPPFARTRWYTVKAVLRGAESDFAAPVPMTGYSVPIRAIAKRLFRAAFRRGELLAALATVLLVPGIAWLWARRRRLRKEKL